jgi:hypothetical protein
MGAQVWGDCRILRWETGECKRISVVDLFLRMVPSLTATLTSLYLYMYGQPTL